MKGFGGGMMGWWGMGDDCLGLLWHSAGFWRGD